jgi:hypothetical protein
MNALLSFSIVLSLTLLTSFLLTRYLHSHLKRLLLDLCKTQEQMQFWADFSSILLVGFPILIALNFHPDATTLEESFFEILARTSGNLTGYPVMLIGIVLILSFFTLLAPKPKAAE